MITLQDKELLAKKGISEEQIAEQLACFEKGFPYLKLSAAASVEQGILAPDADEQKKYLNAWGAYTQTDKTVVKFVPASGAGYCAVPLRRERSRQRRRKSKRWYILRRRFCVRVRQPATGRASL